MRPLTVPEMRILLTADAVGGVWRHAVDLGAAFARQGAAVALAVLGPPPGPAQRAEARLAGLELHRLDVPLDWTVEPEEAQNLGAAELAALAADWQPTVLHLSAPPLAAQLRRHGMPAGPALVVASHSCLASWWAAMRDAPLPPAWHWHRAATAEGLAAADAVVAPSRSHAAAMRQVYGPLPALQVVHNGSRPPARRGAAEAGPPRQPVAIAAGRWWDEAKNAEVLDAAAAAGTCPVAAAGPLTGPEGSRRSFRAATWLGDLPHAELMEWLEGAAIFVSPARYEPFGLTVLEAALRGCALLLSDIPTFRELWDGCALFVPATDAAGFAAALARLQGDPALRQRLAQAAGQRTAQFTVERQAERFLEIYRAAAAARSQAA